MKKIIIAELATIASLSLAIGLKVRPEKITEPTKTEIVREIRLDETRITAGVDTLHALEQKLQATEDEILRLAFRRRMLKTLIEEREPIPLIIPGIL